VGVKSYEKLTDKFYGETRHIRRDFTERASCEPVQAHDKKTIERPSTLKRSHKKHRNREEIVANVLEAARNGATKTRIMYKCYVSHRLLQKYLGYAIENGFLFYDSGSNKHYTTSKGVQYLDYFEECRDTESELVHKKRLISEILENNRESMMANFADPGTNDMLPHLP
jgi:predicted transcriptional regulator